MLSIESKFGRCGFYSTGYQLTIELKKILTRVIHPAFVQITVKEFA